MQVGGASPLAFGSRSTISTVLLAASASGSSVEITASSVVVVVVVDTGMISVVDGGGEYTAVVLCK